MGESLRAESELAQRLRMIRDLNGRSLRALEREVGVSSSSLSRYFAGQTVPPWPVVVALCRLVQRDPRPLRRLWETASGLPQVPVKKETRSGNHLPFDVPDFTGRQAELAQVLAVLAEKRAVSIDGMAGVGKTCLAVHAAHLLTADYPDGQFYLDLHGFTPGKDATDPAQALRLLLGAAGVSAARIPDDPEQCAARWRAELSRRRAIVVLDNVANADQARLLLPGAGSSVVLVTSRMRLIDLDGVTPTSLTALEHDDAVRMFTAASAGDHAARDPAAVAEVLRKCGYLPLAIRVAAARLRHRPGWTVAVLADRLRSGTSHFDAAFAMSLRQLNRTQVRMFRLLGLLPGADLDDLVAARLADVPVNVARALLEDLVDAHLLEQPTAGRYRLHDLVREHAYRVALAEEPDAERCKAFQRVLDFYGQCAFAASSALPYVHGIASLNPAGPAGALPHFADKRAALAWYDREYGNLVAVIDRAADAGLDPQVSQLPSVMRPYYFRRANTADEVRLLELALAAVRRLGDPHRLASLRVELGSARYSAGDLAQARQEYETAEALLSTVDDPGLAGLLALNLGYLSQDTGAADQALEAFRLAAQRFHDAGNPMGEAHALAFQGWALLELGRESDAARAAGTAAQMQNQHGTEGWQQPITALVTLGVAIARQRPDEALTHLRLALRLAQDDDHLQNQAWCLNYLGVALRHAGRYEEAVEHHRRTFELVEELGEAQWAGYFRKSYQDTLEAAGR